MAFGVHKLHLQLRKELADFWNVKETIIYSTGWLAAYGVIRGLIREYDHIVIDKLAHNSLQEGAKNSTKNIYFVEHLNNKAYEEKIKVVREKRS